METRGDEIVFKVHGLNVDNGLVRADVFAKKLHELVAALREADRFTNGRVQHEYIITDLEIGSAAVKLREKQITKDRPTGSGVVALSHVVTSIYNGDNAVEKFYPDLVKRVKNVTHKVEETFSHAEIAFSNQNVVRIDDFMARQAVAAFRMVTEAKTEEAPKYYRGVAFGSFDGELKQIDSRGTMLRGKLILSAGGVEIDCVMNKERIPQARNCFDKRVIVDAVAHYDGVGQLPARLDIRLIRNVKEKANMLRWRGSLRDAQDDQTGEDW